MIDPVDRWAPGVAGRGLLRASLWSTVVFTVTAVGGVVLGGPLRMVALVVALVCFAVGTVAFAWSYLIAIGRSRDEIILVPGIYFLSGTAPSNVRRLLLAMVAVQVVVAITAASVRPFTSAAFAILAPMVGMGLCGLWGARHGTFEPRPPQTPRRARVRRPAPTTTAGSGTTTTDDDAPPPPTVGRDAIGEGDA